MSGPNLTLSERLGRALDRGQLPAGGPAEAAERLIERLERPVRVALMGLQDSGKSSILNILAGREVVPGSVRLPTILVQRGFEERMICTLPDGSAELLPGLDFSDAAALSPALVTLEIDLAVLGVISLLEVAPGGSDTAQRRAMAWATKRADIIAWCSTAFLPKEQMLWESMPDAVKDNGFLLLTKSDLLGGKDAVTGVLDRLTHRARDQFRQILPVSAQLARAAMQPDGSVDRVMFRESGASGVISAIKGRVEMARRADADTAELLLARHCTPEAQQRPNRRGPDPVPQVRAAPSQEQIEVRVPPAEYQPPPTPRPVETKTPPVAKFAPPAYRSPVYQPPGLSKPTPLLLVPKVDPPEVRVRARVAARPAVQPTATREAISPADLEMVAAAVAALMDSAAELSARLADVEKIPVEAVLDHVRATAEKVADMLQRCSARQARRITSDLGEVQDLIMLMQLEKGPAPADDALTLLLQVRRDLETLQAA